MTSSQTAHDIRGFPYPTSYAARHNNYQPASDTERHHKAVRCISKRCFSNDYYRCTSKSRCHYQTIPQNHRRCRPPAHYRVMKKKSCLSTIGVTMIILVCVHSKVLAAPNICVWYADFKQRCISDGSWTEIMYGENTIIYILFYFMIDGDNPYIYSSGSTLILPYLNSHLFANSTSPIQRMYELF